MCKNPPRSIMKTTRSSFEVATPHRFSIVPKARPKSVQNLYFSYKKLKRTKNMSQLLPKHRFFLLFGTLWVSFLIFLEVFSFSNPLKWLCQRLKDAQFPVGVKPNTKFTKFLLQKMTNIGALKVG